MAQSIISGLGDFGTRSLVTHALMAAAISGAVLSALFVEGTLGDLSFVALINLAAGMWISQSVHSLGNSYTDSDYKGVLNHIMEKV